MWTPDLMQRLAKLAAPGATAATWSAARPLRDALAAAGFAVERRPGLGSKVHMTAARYAPRFTPPRPAAWASRAGAGEARDRRAIVIGAGLAGCAAAHALARQGWQVTLIDALPEPAMATSGNPAGLMHPIINVPDSLHSRWFRAAALRTAALARPALLAAAAPAALGGQPGQLDGLIRLAPELSPERAQSQIQALGLPAELVSWLSAEQAAAATGLPVETGAWRFGAAGWLSPAAWCCHLLALAASYKVGSSDDKQPPCLLRFIGNQSVAAIRRQPETPATPAAASSSSAETPGAAASTHDAPLFWHALDAQGRTIAAAPVLVLANAAGATGLLAQVPDLHAALPDKLERIRGQTTVIQLDRLDPAQRASLCLPRLPVSGQGYAIHIPADPSASSDGEGERLLVGATSQPGDLDPSLRLSDQHDNLKRAAALGVFGPQHRHEPPAWALALPLAGRVGWRLTTPDRLPVIGPPVDRQALARARAARARVDAPRLMPRCHDEFGGVYLCTGLGSRGITSAVLGGELLAAWVTGAPCPMDGELRDVVDVQRFGS
jgi:tRNA 5-methylaminomethyl-2-thiouridine biosynthesis bifunctional protein